MWINTYINFYLQVRNIYPQPIKIFLGCGPMSETYQFCPALTSMVATYSKNDTNLFLLDFRIPGLKLTGCLGHPNWWVGRWVLVGAHVWCARVVLEASVDPRPHPLPTRHVATRHVAQVNASHIPDRPLPLGTVLGPAHHPFLPLRHHLLPW